ncbi:MAG: glycerol-3-phosphate dehydrogenase [Gammaproteobacteria bacterium TMED107]|nr:glycerol-3-phosphate dehydrogenase [Gammaproteobacteria bacterium]OUX77329.1 MAG: glycerol-3-phosphate dehydrogenase [Gammaproteobacteria bacterium TMED107]
MTKSKSEFDLLVIGGGSNGAGIAADAAGRGLSVALLEKGDLACATSSWSSKLIHGGLRYLENYQFGLVRKSLKEREVLTKAAPHLVTPLAFQIPMLPESRSAILLRCGLFLYDSLAKRKHYEASRAVRYCADSPLKASIRKGFEYWDAQVDDSRLVVVNALQAKQRGAVILTRHEVTDATANLEGWSVAVKGHLTGIRRTLTCKVLVNAAGPWVSQLHGKIARSVEAHQLKLVKGSHLVLPKLSEQNRAFLLQHGDGRVVFVIPYLNDFSLVGTTEEEYSGDLDAPQISEAEVSYLLKIVNRYFNVAVSNEQIVGAFSGIRPLIESEGEQATRVSRDYRMQLHRLPAPMLSVYGGKVTTYRLLAEQVLERLRDFFPFMTGSWTKSAVLPGGDFETRDKLQQQLVGRYPWLRLDLINRWLTGYGTCAAEIVGAVRSMGDLGVCFGANLFQLEVDYLCSREWAITAEDILWRRTKLGYLFSEQEVKSLSTYLDQCRRTQP